jgi:hypothetical protein
MAFSEQGKTTLLHERRHFVGQGDNSLWTVSGLSDSCELRQQIALKAERIVRQAVLV